MKKKILTENKLTNEEYNQFEYLLYNVDQYSDEIYNDSMLDLAISQLDDYINKIGGQNKLIELLLLDNKKSPEDICKQLNLFYQHQTWTTAIVTEKLIEKLRSGESVTQETQENVTSLLGHFNGRYEEKVLYEQLALTAVQTKAFGDDFNSKLLIDALVAKNQELATALIQVNPDINLSNRDTKLDITEGWIKDIAIKANYCSVDIKNNQIDLPEYQTIFTNGHDVYRLTPFEKPSNGNGKEFYDEDGGRFKFFNQYRSDPTEEVFSNSISTHIGTLSEDSYINSVIGKCHLIYAKAVNSARTWFTHYDPCETRTGQNKYAHIYYDRESYCDLDPKIPYQVTEANLGQNEKIDVVVIVPQGNTYDISDSNYTNTYEGKFNYKAFCDRIGASKINSIKVNKYQQESLDGKICVKFYPYTNKMVAIDIGENEGRCIDIDTYQGPFLLNEEAFTANVMGDTTITTTGAD